MGRGYFLNTTGLSSISQDGAHAYQRNVKVFGQTSTSVRPENGAFSFDIGETERGIILSNPMSISGASIFIESTFLDASELRRALLFWDLIVWPASKGIYISGGLDEDFLISENRLVRPKFSMEGNSAAGLSIAFTDTLKILEKKRPGQWMMSHGGSSLAFSGKELLNDRGVLTTLTNFIPVPMHDMPLEDVLRFKDARLPEVLALRSSLDRLYQDWVNSEDQEHQLRSAINVVDMASADMIKVARESRNAFALSSWKMSFSVSAVDALKGLLSGKAFGLDTASSLLMGAASAISFSKDVGLKSAERNSPFSYPTFPK